MQPIVVFNYFALCLFVFICTADAVDNATGDGYIDDAVADGDADDAVSDVDLNDAVADGPVDDAVADGPVNDEVAGVATDDAVADRDVNDAVADEGVDDAIADGDLDNAVADEDVDDAVADDVNGTGADQPVNGDEMKDDAINEDENENLGQGDAPVEDKQSINTGVQDDDVKLDEAVDDNNINDAPDYLLDGEYRLDKTFVEPVFNLSSAEIKKFKLWPRAEVQYYIDEFSYDKVMRDKIRESLNNARSRLRFVNFKEMVAPIIDNESTNERWVFFVNRRGQLDCKDYSPKSFTFTLVQKVVVGYDCLRDNGAMAAIVLALLGVPPMHNAPDRDHYITVHKDHILPEKMGLFKRLKNDEWLFHDLPYDYNSVSHYPLHKYTADGIATITINKANPGRRDGSKTGKVDPKEDKLKGGHGSMRHKQKQDPMNNALTKLDAEEKDFSFLDIHKVELLYKNLWYQKENKGLKLEDCKGLYRARPGLSNTRLNQPKNLPEKPKPKLYLAAVQKLFGTKDVFGETLSSLEGD